MLKKIIHSIFDPSSRAPNVGNSPDEPTSASPSPTTPHNWRTRLRQQPEFWHNKRDHSAPNPLPFWAWPLLPLSRFYELGRILHPYLIRPHQAPVPVICVGNVVVGGAGKTPLALAFGEALLSRGVNVHFLSRGYGGREKGPVRVDCSRHRAVDVGDEALLLGECAPCWVARNRYQGAIAASKAGAELVLMDDGFQNPGIYKDRSYLVVDENYGVGNGHLLPVGPLRERLEDAGTRADGIVLISPSVSQQIPDYLTALELPITRAVLSPEKEMKALKGKRIIAFAGIGHPQKFFSTLDDLGAKLIEALPFPDHHTYSLEDVDFLRARAKEKGAYLVTTSKDFQRLPTDFTHEVIEARVKLILADEKFIIDIIQTLK